MKPFFRFFTFMIPAFCISQLIVAQNSDVLFASSQSLPASPNSSKSFPAKFISFQATLSNNKVMMQWVVGQNETADQFEVEKSVDGKNFSMAALVFGTDKPESENYMFYEKNNVKKVYYRVKCIDKNRTVSYSAVVAIDPAGNKTSLASL